MPNGMSERSVLIEHCGVGGSVRKDTLYPICNFVMKIGVHSKYACTVNVIGHASHAFFGM